jgi:hypothetical protein
VRQKQTEKSMFESIYKSGGWLCFFVALGLLAAPYITVLSSEVEMRTMYNGKALVTRGVFYYDIQSEKSVLRLTSPEEVISIEEKSGNTVSYIPKTNTANYKQKAFSSTSDNLFKYFFKSGYPDLGLKNRGFALASSTIKDNLVVKLFTPPAALANSLQKLELVLQKNQPIYIASYDLKGRIANKTYFTKYASVQGMEVPLQITDFQYMYLPKNKKDSIVTRTLYHTIKTNEQVDRNFLNYKIPVNATIVSE